VFSLLSITYDSDLLYDNNLWYGSYIRGNTHGSLIIYDRGQKHEILGSQMKLKEEDCLKQEQEIVILRA